jgi:hypothetical protein
MASVTRGWLSVVVVIGLVSNGLTGAFVDRRHLLRRLSVSFPLSWLALHLITGSVHAMHVHWFAFGHFEIVHLVCVPNEATSPPSLDPAPCLDPGRTARQGYAARRRSSGRREADTAEELLLISASYEAPYRPEKPPTNFAKVGVMR